MTRHAAEPEPPMDDELLDVRSDADDAESGSADRDRDGDRLEHALEQTAPADRNARKYKTWSPLEVTFWLPD